MLSAMRDRLLSLPQYILQKFEQMTDFLLRLRLPARGSDRPQPDRRSLPVLCFGDSITEGYHNIWPHPKFAPDRSEFPDGRIQVHEHLRLRCHPYAIHLGAALAADVGDAADGYKASLRYARARGFSGWTAAELLPELRRCLREDGWRCAVILVGCNDVLLEGVTDPDVVLGRIDLLYEACDACGVPVIGVTNLDVDTANHGMVPPELQQTYRDTLAAVAEGVAARCRAQGRPLVDARRALPLCAEFFDDAIHPSPEGSVTLANEVHTVICRRSW